MTREDVMDSAASYTVGGAGILVGLAEQAQSITIILACVIVLLRLVYDGVKLYRYLKQPADE